MPEQAITKALCIYQGQQINLAYIRLRHFEFTNGRIISDFNGMGGFAPIFPDICYHLTHYKPAAADIPVASDNPAHYADAIRYNAR
ncbi:hypothetical protein, partial [Escherichia coli]|uniref:hypothetical protein n=1 Tax=Escherichia coli TaxID=562 RepID=UPI001BC8A28A